MSTIEDRLKLRFHHNVIEHLGLRLYDNKSDKVICELVSNAWDADACQVAIDTTENGQQLVVLDDGIGMSREVLQKAYLTIAAPRRSGQNATSTSPSGRLLMGRKGIGKLAPFGICRTIDVITGSESTGFEWITLDLNRIQSVSPAADDDSPGEYSPTEHVRNGTLSDIADQARLTDARDAFVDLVKTSPKKSGTCIVLTSINDRVKLADVDFRRALGGRFTVTLTRSDFIVSINGRPITQSEALPDFAFRIPPAGSIKHNLGTSEISYWVGFTDKPVSKTHDYGIGVYAHGKIAQERPFWFDSTGNDLHIPYMYGVVEADFIDDFAEDIISTDRTSIDWTHPQAKILHEWGKSNVRKWIAEFEVYRRDRDAAATSASLDRGEAEGRIPKLTTAERRSLVELLAEISPQLPPNEEARMATVTALADAWLHKPAREMISRLWKDMKQTESGGQTFAATVDTLREYLVPEALSASVTFAQRAFALTILHEIIHLGQEPDLQKLLETFPWIAGPELEYLTANQRLSSVVALAKERGLFARDDDRIVRDELKPDFVFLSDAPEEKIVVIELKSPQEELTIENREQLYSYMTYLEGKYPNSKIRGLLLGNAPGQFKNPRSDVQIRSWSEVFLLARSSYTSILASMLSGYADDPSDARIGNVHDFGGEKVWSMLQSVAEKDEHLRFLLGGRTRAALPSADDLDLSFLLSQPTGLAISKKTPPRIKGPDQK